MQFTYGPEYFQGVWSAMPTPLTEGGLVDAEALEKLVEHQIRLGIQGLFIAGTAGEGPWLTDDNRRTLAKKTVRCAAGRLPIAMQITDNSSGRMLDNLKRGCDCGIDLAVLAPPFFQVGATQSYLAGQFTEIIDASPVPMGIYNRGRYASVVIEPETLKQLLRHPKVMLVKDSSADPEYAEAILAVKRQRAGTLFALYGNEFDFVDALDAGYDGLLFGGACFNGAVAGRVFALAKAGKTDEAKELQQRMGEMLYKVFGGRELACWLAGQKELMRRLGVFHTAKTLLAYQVTPDCSAAIDEVIRDEQSWLLPGGEA